jgi:glycosyltransferase involved in cell wall biosynthesis
VNQDDYKTLASADANLLDPELVCIVIPFYNSERFLAETLHSVQKQSYKNWECLLVDDGSTDESVSICQKFQREDDRFRCLKRTVEPKGASASRNVGLTHANGEYVLFLDADDIMAETCLQSRVKYMSENPTLDFVVFQIEMFGLQTKRITSHSDDYLREFIGFDFQWQTSSPLWKTDFVRKLGGFNVEIDRFEDPELHIRALRKTTRYSILVDAEPDLFYRQWRSPNRGKSPSYYQELKAYTQYLKILPEIVHNTPLDIRITRKGVFLFLDRLITPLEDLELTYMNNMLDQARKDGILGPIRYRALKARSYLLKIWKARLFQRIVLISMQLITSPKQFTSLYSEVTRNKLRIGQKEKADA